MGKILDFSSLRVVFCSLVFQMFPALDSTLRLVFSPIDMEDPEVWIFPRKPPESSSHLVSFDVISRGFPWDFPSNGHLGGSPFRPRLLRPLAHDGRPAAALVILRRQVEPLGAVAGRGAVFIITSWIDPG